MLERKQEYIAEALNEIRDGYIEEAALKQEQSGLPVEVPAGKPKKMNRIYRIAGIVAACLVVVIVLGTGVRYMSDQKDPSEAAAGAEGVLENDLSPAGSAPEAAQDAGTVIDETVEGSVPIQEVETGASSLMWYTPEEIFDQNIIIVRGTVESLVQVEGTPVEGSSGGERYTQLTVLVTDCLKGDLKEGDRCIIKIPILLEYKNYYDDHYGALTQLSEGSEGIFMPRVGTPYYFDEGRRYLFLETTEGVAYAKEVYDIPCEGSVTLNDVEAYIRDVMKEEDR